MHRDSIRYARYAERSQGMHRRVQHDKSKESYDSLQIANISFLNLCYGMENRKYDENR